MFSYEFLLEFSPVSFTSYLLYFKIAQMSSALIPLPPFAFITTILTFNTGLIGFIQA